MDGALLTILIVAVAFQIVVALGFVGWSLARSLRQRALAAIYRYLRSPRKPRR